MKFEMTDVLEAELVMRAVADARLDALIASAQKGPAGDAADVAAKILGRVERRIVDTFIPEDPRRAILEDEIEFGLL